MKKYPKIGQLAQAVKAIIHQKQFVGMNIETGEVIYDKNRPLGTQEFIGTVKLHGCVHSDSMITLADGSREMIKNIVPGTSVLSYNEETNQIEFDSVNDVIIQELDKEWVRLEFDDGSFLKCTVDHPILTTDGWVDAINLTENHELITD